MDDFASATIKQWLESILLPQYLPLFAASGYKELSQCALLTEGDLDKIGITPAGHRKRLLTHLPAADCSNSEASVAGTGESPLPAFCQGSRMEVNNGYIDMDASSFSSAEQGSQSLPGLVTLPNVALGESTPRPPSNQGCVPPQASQEYIGPDPGFGAAEADEDPPEDCYHVPPRTSQSMEEGQAEAVYANMEEEEEEKPPVLPPKQRDQREKGGIITAAGPPLLVVIPKKPERAGSPLVRPIPAPRKSLQKRPTPVPRSRNKQSAALAGVTTDESSDDCRVSATEMARTSSPALVGPRLPPIGEPASIQPVVATEPSPMPASKLQSARQQEQADTSSRSFVEIYEVASVEEALENQRNEDLESLETSRADSHYDNAESLEEKEDTAFENQDDDDNDDYLPMSPPAVQRQGTKPPAVGALKEVLGAATGGQVKPSACKVWENDYEISDGTAASSGDRLGVQGMRALAAPEKQPSIDAQIPPEPSPAISESTAYQPIWVMESGSKDLMRFDSLDFPGVCNGNQPKKDATLFNQPPPSFAPPPLPPGVRVSQITGLPPPAVPPRIHKNSQDDAASRPASKSAEASGRDSLGFWKFSESRAKPDNPMNQPVVKQGLAERSSVPDLFSSMEESLKKPQSLPDFDPFAPLEPTGSCKQPFYNLERTSLRADNTYGNLKASRPPPAPPASAGAGTSVSVNSIPAPPLRVPNQRRDRIDSEENTYCLEEFVDHTDFPGWESEDTLSDGGDFYESREVVRPSYERLEASIPIVPAVQRSVTTRKGFLHKYSSDRSSMKRNWHKRWVTFDGRELNYFATNKSMLTKRIIPADSMVDITQVIKIPEQHPYRFLLKTVDRVYTFAAEDSDDLAMWTNILMRAVLDRIKMGFAFEEGGEMAKPDKEGFVKLEGIKGKRYIALKKEKFCFYNTHKDFKAASPMHLIDTKLASVKDAGSKRVQLLTPYISHMLAFDTADESEQWKESLETSIANALGDDSILKEVWENNSNKYCADCGSPDAEWVSLNLAVTLCKTCAGIHRNLSDPVSKIRSLRMDTRVWTPTLIQLLKVIGNDNANNFWEWNSSEDVRIDPDADIQARKDYIQEKYADRQYCRLHPLHTDQKALNEALCKSVQYGNLQDTMELIFSGAEITCTSSTYSKQEKKTPIQLAKKANQMLQVEFLHQNGAESADGATGSFRQKSGSTRRSLPNVKGFLYKTGPSHRGEFLKRYAILDHGMLSYYENDRSSVAKDTIERKDMLSVALIKDDRCEHTFELTTRKQGGRTYLFGATSSDLKKSWVVGLAKSFAPIDTRTIEQIKDFDRAGLVYLKTGATMDWSQRWIHLRDKTLFVYHKEEDSLKAIDLRKIKSIVKLQYNKDGCSEASEPSHPFVIDLPDQGRALYVQADMRKDSEAWFLAIHAAATESAGDLSDQQLTPDDIPVLVDRCINFVDIHGLQMEGIYRRSGQHSKVSKMLELFNADARGVHIRPEEYEVHEVATVLKRFFRQLSDPLLTTEYYAKWIETAAFQDLARRIQWYKYLLEKLPRVNYCTLKKLLVHLSRVTAHESVNKMSLMNLASIFGPVLMTLDKGTEMSSGYVSTSREIAVIRDLMENHRMLFEIKDDDLAKERKIADAIKLIERLQDETVAKSIAPTNELLIGVHIKNLQGQEVTLKVSDTMTAGEVLDFVLLKTEQDLQENWALFEVLCNGEMERPLHYSEKVLSVILCWSSWPDAFRTGNYMCVKRNTVYENVELVFDPLSSLFSELKFSEKKGWRKFCFEFSQFKLSYQRDTKASTQLGSWNVEDLAVYVGVQQKRNPPTAWSLTFIQRSAKEVSHKDSPFFGHSICCSTKQEMYRWLAAILHAQHPEGLVVGFEPKPSSAPQSAAAASIDLNAVVPPVSMPPLNSTAEGPLMRGKSIFQRFMSKR